MSELPVGPIVEDACYELTGRGANNRCGLPEAKHRTSFMDLHEGLVDHNYVQPPPRPYEHEVVAAMITTEWHCHACGRINDVWGTGADEGYMECQAEGCGAYSWLTFDPHGFEAKAVASRTTEGAGV